jgi:hypothetical protein
LPDILVGRESNLGVALAFQDFLVHFVVATRISGVSAGSIHDYQAAGRAIGWIEMNGSTLKRESSAHGMESGCQCELDPGIRWIEFESHFLRAKRFRVQAKQQKLKVRPVSAGNDSRRPAWMESAHRS